jgi:hypothetical protein
MKLTTEIGMSSAPKKNTGARWEIAVDGTPRSYRDRKEIAIASAEFLKSMNPGAEVAVRDYPSTILLAGRSALGKSRYSAVRAGGHILETFTILPVPCRRP